MELANKTSIHLQKKTSNRRSKIFQLILPRTTTENVGSLYSNRIKEKSFGNNHYIINQLKYNTKISDNNAESGKVPRMLAAFPR
jgi:hypothetical protein